MLDGKRTKLSSGSPTSTTNTPTASTSALTSNPLCANHSTRSSPIFPQLPATSTDLPKPCGNSGTTKCSNLACKACCSKLRSLPENESSSTFKCEFHEDKELKAKTRNDEMKAHKQRKKEQGKIKAMENEARDKELSEKRRKERQEKQEKQDEDAEEKKEK